MAHFCSMEHDGNLEDSHALQALAAGCSGGSPVAVEIGAWAGETTRMLASLGYRVFAVDPWTGNPDDRLGEVAERLGPPTVCRTFCRNMGEQLFRSIFPLVGTSKFWASAWPSSLPIDLLYIDGDHRYEYVAHDILEWSKHVRPGGIIAGHDFGMFEGVTRAVEESGPYQRAGRLLWWREKE